MFKKAFKRIGKDRIKMTVNFQALNLTLSCQEPISVRMQITRGDQRPENLELVHIPGKRGQQTVSFPRNSTAFECSYFIKDGVPDAKMARLTFYANDQAGGGAYQISTLEINFSQHFGAQFEESTTSLSPTPQAQAKNIIVKSIRYKASITPKKDKDSAAMAQCVDWRTQEDAQERQKQAAIEEQKRALEQRRQAELEARKRQSEHTKHNEPIRGLGGFNDAQATTNSSQQRTSSQAAPTLQSSSLLQSQDAATNQRSGKRLEMRTQSQARPESESVTNSLAKTQMAPDMAQLDKTEQRRSLNRAAVKLDLRASQELNREAVKGDLRSASGSNQLAPTYEKSEDGSSVDGDDDPFAGVLGAKEESKDAARAQGKKATGGDTESEGGDSDADLDANHRTMMALQARQKKEEREKDLEIERLQNEIKTHEQGSDLQSRKLQIEQQIKTLQEAIEQNEKETGHAIRQRDPEKQQLLAEVAQLTAQVDQQSQQVSLLEKELTEPRTKLEEAERELRSAHKADTDAQQETESLEETLTERRQFLELESAEVAKEIALVAELEAQNTELTATLEEHNMAFESKTGQIVATCKFLDDMEGESEKIAENITECDEQLQIQGNSEIIAATSEANRLRHERNDLEKAKHEMQEEAIQMRTQGIELQQKITAGREKLKNIESYTRELEVVIEDSQQEASKHRAVISQQKIQRAKEIEAQKERDKIKKKIAAKKKRERQKSQHLQAEEAAQLQRTQTQARIDEELDRAANEITEQFNEEENESRIIDESQIIVEDLEESSVKSQEKILDELQDTQQLTAEERAEMFHDHDAVNQSRVSVKDGIDISFFSDGRAAHQQSFRSEREDDDDGGAFNFDALMRERVARDTFRASESHRNSILQSAPDGLPEHYQTPVKDSTKHFEASESIETRNQTLGKPETATLQYSDKSVTEPDQLSLSQHRGNENAGTSAMAKGTPDAAWYSYQEQKSGAQDDTSPLLTRGGEKSMLTQIAHIENHNLPRESLAGETVLMEQIAALEGKGDEDSSDGNSAYDSFHSEENEAPTAGAGEKVEAVDAKKDWMSGQYASKLASIKEDRSDSIVSHRGEDKAEMIRFMAGSAVAANIAHDSSNAAHSGRFGAVGPHDPTQKQATPSIGSVRAAKEGVELDERKESQTERTPISSHVIRQKILLATTPRSKAQVVEELRLELGLVNEDIAALQNLGEGSNSPERSLSVNSNTAVPIINPSTQDRLQEKYRVRDQIEAGLKSLEDRERRQNMIAMSAASEERDPYAPTDSSSFISTSLRQSIDNRQSRTSSFSSASSRERGGSRGSVYRSTHYDREQRTRAGKSRRQIYTELAMRDTQFMLVTGKHVFSALSDYELMEAFNQFEAMLRMDKTSHEAMFGLGKLNFMIKRYELAERWFADAFAKKRDYVYRAWLGFTYVQLYKAVPDDNPKGLKYLGYAIKNLTRCVKEDDLAPFAITALLFLSVDVQKQAKPGPVKGLEEPAKYLSGLQACLKGKGPLEYGLAQAYVDLNTAGRVSQGVSGLSRLMQQFSAQPEAYLMLSRHHSLRKEYADEKRVLAQAMAKCTEFQSYPERLILTLAHAKNLCNDHQVNSHLEAANLLQLQYTRTPHYASSLLYAYGKAIIDCQIVQLLPNAISALEEAQRCSVSLRVHNCFAYIAKAFDQMQRYPLYVSMHAMNYRLGAAQLTYRVGATKPSKKQIMVEQLSRSSEALMFEIISAVQSVAALQNSGDSMYAAQSQSGSPRYSTVSFADNSRSSFQMRSQTMVGGSAANGSQASRLNMFASPLTQLPVNRDQPDFSGLLLPLEGEQRQEIEQEVQKLLQMTNRLGSDRDKFICQGLIVRGLRNDSAQVHDTLLMQLMRQKEEIGESQDVQLQTLLVRTLRKSNQLRLGRLDPVQEGMRLIDMVRETFNSQGSRGNAARPPVTTVCLVEAHIEAAKLFFKLSQSEANNSTSLSSGTLLQLALNVLLMTLPVLPTIDYKLGNPQLPVQVEQHGIADLELIDFTNCASLTDLASRMEEMQEAPNTSQNFSQSPLMKLKVQSNHFMIQGSIPLDPKQRSSQMGLDDTKCAVFNFPETLAENVSEIDSLSTWSSTSLSAVATFLESGQASSMAQMLTRLGRLHVHSSPDVLKHIGRFCIKSGKYADLAIYALREYLISMTHSKMFTLAAGQGLSDETTVLSGYTIIRDKTMLQMAQALAMIATDRKGAPQAKKAVIEDAQKLINKVQKGGNAQAAALGQELNKTVTLLKSVN